MKKKSFSTWSGLEDNFHSKMDVAYKENHFIELRDAPFLFVSRQVAASVFARYELAKMALLTKGSVVECGCHQGNSLFLYHHFFSIMEPYGLNRKIIGFDTFEGFAGVSEKDQVKENEDFKDASYDLIQQLSEIHDFNRPVGHIPKLEVIRGDARSTIPKYVENHPELIISLLYIDFDIYEPTLTAIDYLLPLVPKGGVVVFDELSSKRFVGETSAFKERLRVSSVELRCFAFEPWLSYFIV